MAPKQTVNILSSLVLKSENVFYSMRMSRWSTGAVQFLVIENYIEYGLVLTVYVPLPILAFYDSNTYKCFDALVRVFLFFFYGKITDPCIRWKGHIYGIAPIASPWGI